MTNLEIFQLLRPIVMTVTGVPECIMADPNAKSPTGAYASIRVRQAIRERGQANVNITNLPETRQVRYDVRAQIICDVSVDFYRGTAMEYAEKLKECHKRPDVPWILMRAGVGWGGTDAVNNLTALQSGNMEQRAQITVRLYYESVDIVDVNNIERVKATVENEKGQTIQSVDVTVSS